MTIRLPVLLTCVGGAVLLSACTSFVRLSPDFGVAVRQDEAAQIANPDARYAGIPAPGANGVRNALAESRYERDEVIPPSSLTSVGSITATGNTGAGQPAGTATSSAGPM